MPLRKNILSLLSHPSEHMSQPSQAGTFLLKLSSDSMLITVTTEEGDLHSQNTWRGAIGQVQMKTTPSNTYQQASLSQSVIAQWLTIFGATGMNG